MIENKPLLSLLACLIAGILAAVGIFIEKKDAFNMLCHPLAARCPNISKVFGRVFLGLALVCLVGFLLTMIRTAR